MSDARTWRLANRVALGAFLFGALASILGGVIDRAGFFPAWLCAFLLWLGAPLGALTLVLIHDLTGGRWMAAARPALNAAIATMPLAVLAGVPALLGLRDLYGWTHPAPSLGNTFYLNPKFFLFRFVLYAVLWIVLAGYALWAPRGEATPGAAARRRPRLRGRGRQHRSARHLGRRRRGESQISGDLSPSGRPGRLAFPDRAQGGRRTARRHGRLCLSLRCGNRPVHAPGRLCRRRRQRPDQS
jgi:hypothetical protein